MNPYRVRGRAQTPVFDRLVDARSAADIETTRGVAFSEGLACAYDSTRDDTGRSGASSQTCWPWWSTVSPNRV